MASQPPSLFYLPFRPALDANGIVAPGAKLFFYLTQTAIPQKIYANASLTVELENPVGANAAGVWPSIYMDPALTYRVVLKDQDGITLNEVDPYRPGVVGEGEKGDTGPANSTYPTLATLKNAPVSNGTYSLVTTAGRTDYAYVPGDFTGLADDVIVIKLNAVPLTTGALLITGTVNEAAFGISTTKADNGPAFGLMTSVSRYLAIQYAIPPRIDIRSGIYKTSGLDASGQPVNWAVQGMTLTAQPGVVLLHTGSGRAMTFDGGATGGGVGMIKIIGGLVVRGNANTTDGIYQRAIHHSTFDIEVQNVSVAALRTEWAVCNEYWIRCSPVYRPAFNPTPSVGLFLSERNIGEKTSRCTFYNPILEGINGYGINCDSAIINTFLGGTSESNVGGIFLSANSSANIIDGLDMEFNTVADVFCLGLYNVFRNCLSDSSCEFRGLLNTVNGGLFNNLLNSGDTNCFESINYAIAGGVFTDTGTQTQRRRIRNATTQQILADVYNNSTGITQFGNIAAGALMGRADLVSNGSANDIVLARQSGGKFMLQYLANGRFGLDVNGIGFFQKASAPIAQPYLTGSRSSNTALKSVIDALAAYGLVSDGTTE